MYVLACNYCNTEYHFKGLFAKRKYNEFGRLCPICGKYLFNFPIVRYKITPPPYTVGYYKYSKIKIIKI